MIAGASNDTNSVANRVARNILDGGYAGKLYLVNAKHRRILDLPTHRSIRKLPETPDLAIILTPADTLERMIDNCAETGIKVALIMTLTDKRAGLIHHARARGVRILGPGSAGVIRPDIALNATYSENSISRGKLAVISQSAALISAVVDWADNNRVGFSTLLATGAELDISMADVVDFLANDRGTNAIILYIDKIPEARAFLSAINAAARNKPVIVMKSTQDGARYCDVQSRTGTVHSSDSIFQAALERAGAVRIRTFSNLFSAARTLSSGQRTQGKRLAIVSNGAAPAMLACDRIVGRGFELPALPALDRQKINECVGGNWSQVNPVVIRQYDTIDDTFSRTVELLLACDQFDAVLALYSPDPRCDALSLARSVAEVASKATKPVLTCWMGEAKVRESRDYFNSHGVLTFRTPEAATNAFDFLYRYWRSQQLLLQLPDSVEAQLENDYKATRSLAQNALSSGGRLLSAEQNHAILRMMGIVASADPLQHQRTLSVRVFNDATFSRTLSLGLGGDMQCLFPEQPVQLPPLNRYLIDDLLADERISQYLGPQRGRPAANVAMLSEFLQKLSTLVCEVPEIFEIEFSNVLLNHETLHIADMQTVIQTVKPGTSDYPHLSIHPYPRALQHRVTLKNGESVTIRPVRPEDGEAIASMVANMSEESRYMRFMHAMETLPPKMIAQFTKIDYDRQIAFCAVPDSDPSSIIGVSRYTINPDQTSSEFAIASAEQWQGQGLSKHLMNTLIARARQQGLSSIEGGVLRINQSMRGLMESIGFECTANTEEPEQLVCRLNIQ